ncbi:MAG: hypothetical protein D6675_03295 [Gemmatimonadetes bacterium]|nr:MAG: hypothetical protein D6675_03295 [Gemmatimonadota bacterium]
MTAVPTISLRETAVLEMPAAEAKSHLQQRLKDLNFQLQQENEAYLVYKERRKFTTTNLVELAISLSDKGDKTTLDIEGTIEGIGMIHKNRLAEVIDNILR